MTVDVFIGMIEEIPLMRAERLLDAAASAHPSKAWFDDLGRTLRAAAEDEDDAPVAPRSTFRLNGRPVELADLKGSLAQALGAGFSAN
jgi:hypothetical protein